MRSKDSHDGDWVGGDSTKRSTDGADRGSIIINTINRRFISVSVVAIEAKHNEGRELANDWRTKCDDAVVTGGRHHVGSQRILSILSDEKKMRMKLVK
jgi:hypothetical protein